MSSRSWWGWGHEDHHLDRDALEGFAAEVGRRFELDAAEVREPTTLGALEIPGPRIEAPPTLAQVCSTDPEQRARHSHGQAFRDVVRAFHGEIDAFPDVVARPRDETEVAAVLDWCSDVGAACIPWGGGTSVVGGVNPQAGDRAVVSLDTTQLAGVVEVDARSRLALVRAGTTGPALEEDLKRRGLTLRFYPQSWEFSTVGGWVVTRAGGHDATLRTHIDDLVASVRALTPRGAWESRRLPGSGAGPSPDRLLLGSEGTLGVVTQTWLRVRPRPTYRASAAARFDDFLSGTEAVRAILQAGMYPSNCRLLDAGEAALAGAGDGAEAVLLLGFESAEHPVGVELDRAIEVARDHGGSVPDGPELREGDESGDRSGAAGAWRETFLRAPYLRDALVAIGMVVETFETAVPWEGLPALVDGVKLAVRNAAEQACGQANVTVRLTHAYPDGAAPYFTVIAPGRRGAEVQQWDTIKAAASEAILVSGGTITHHHAVGRDHRPWYDEQRPELFAAGLRAVKSTVDPAGIMNPGVLI